MELPILQTASISTQRFNDSTLSRERRERHEHINRNRCAPLVGCSVWLGGQLQANLISSLAR
jgi:hypothetical protein